ncbi:hypothetical protein FSARC_3612 [Fusarium sarcochroum]|uniref:Porphyromonas-type peptidyl-arginine deiminase n=1 Tax=Fusarium sarcochroum TaxID=1208366 RepID=A0A8H4U3R6_9HYPO|nr:hypothetical protein FSARC_3612 [Fusarium sarcochroum]
MGRRAGLRTLMDLGLMQRSFGRYRMPPEWHRHSQTLTVWPDLGSVGNEKLLQQARSEVSTISNAIARFEPVIMFTRPNQVDEALRSVAKGVTVRPLRASHLWIRDSGPIFVYGQSNGSFAGLKLRFNNWGSKFPSLGDETVAADIIDACATPVVDPKSAALNPTSDILIQCKEALAAEFDEEKVIPATDPGFTSEGGAIEVDGCGTLLATESSIINPNRNPLMTKMQLEEKFIRYLGAYKTIWLPGIKGYDSTDYHIDAFARFIKPGQVLLSRPSNWAEHCVVLAFEEAREILASETDERGHRLEVIEVEEPNPRHLEGKHFGVTVASYANYYLVNGGLIMPRFGVGKLDDNAYELFRKHFPDREIVQVDLNALPRLGGGIHCATQQVPTESELARAIRRGELRS